MEAARLAPGKSDVELNLAIAVSESPQPSASRFDRTGSRPKPGIEHTEEWDSPTLLCRSGNRRSEEAARKRADERPPIHHPIT
jgi:hypothetical protein